MIREDEVFKIGTFGKPHGIKGEISFHFENDIFDKIDCPYFICKIDGIFVPFFITGYRFKGADIALVLLEDVNNEIGAKQFKGVDVYLPRKYFEENNEIEYSLDFFIGFSLVDEDLGYIGVITNIDDATINTLFLVKDKNNKEVIIPASEELITNIDINGKTVYVDLPEGLID